MSIQDPIADMLTRIRNAGLRCHPEVVVSQSNHKLELLRVLKEQGYIEGYEKGQENNLPIITITLKYYNGKSVISTISRVSRPALRRYSGAKKIRSVLGGLGCYIISTSKGLMTDKQAKALGVGGEIICMVA